MASVWVAISPVAWASSNAVLFEGCLNWPLKRQYADALWLSTSWSRSTTNRRAGVWQRPADSFGATRFHRTRLIVNPTKRSSIERAC